KRAPGNGFENRKAHHAEGSKQILSADCRWKAEQERRDRKEAGQEYRADKGDKQLGCERWPPRCRQPGKEVVRFFLVFDGEGCGRGTDRIEHGGGEGRVEER